MTWQKSPRIRILIFECIVNSVSLFVLKVWGILLLIMGKFSTVQFNRILQFSPVLESTFWTTSRETKVIWIFQKSRNQIDLQRISRHHLRELFQKKSKNQYFFLKIDRKNPQFFRISGKFLSTFIPQYFRDKNSWNVFIL